MNECIFYLTAEFVVCIWLPVHGSQIDVVAADGISRVLLKGACEEA